MVDGRDAHGATVESAQADQLRCSLDALRGREQTRATYTYPRLSSLGAAVPSSHAPQPEGRVPAKQPRRPPASSSPPPPGSYSRVWIATLDPRRCTRVVTPVPTAASVHVLTHASLKFRVRYRTHNSEGGAGTRTVQICDYLSVLRGKSKKK